MGSLVFTTAGDIVTVMDEKTKETLRMIHAQLGLEEDIEEEVDWEDVKHVGLDIDTIFEKFYVYTSSFKDRMYRKFKKSKEIIQEILPEHRTGDEFIRELEDAWNMYSKGSDMIPSKDIGLVLRILGQNPTEDQIVQMVMQANCDWEGYMAKSDFLHVGLDILKAACDQMEDVIITAYWSVGSSSIFRTASKPIVRLREPAWVKVIRLIK